MFRSYEELERLYCEQAAVPTPGTGRVDLIVLRQGSVASKAQGATLEKPFHLTPRSADLTTVDGLIGDRWRFSKGLDTQVSIASVQVARIVAGAPERWHLLGDNLVVDLDLSEASVSVGDRFRVGTVMLEVSPKPHTGCDRYAMRFGAHALQWVNDPAHVARRLRGVYCRIVEEGSVTLGDTLIRA